MIVSVPLVFGIGGIVFGNGEIGLKGVSLYGLVAIGLNLVLPGHNAWKKDAEPPERPLL